MKITEAKQVREGLYKAIFASLFAKPTINDVLECSFWCLDESGNLVFDKDNIISSIQEDKDNFSIEMKNMIVTYLNYYSKNVKDFDKTISRYLKNDFSIEKLAKTDLSVIYEAMTEMKCNKELSVKIIVSEAVEIAKKYSSDNSYKFINGILRNIAKELRNE